MKRRAIFFSADALIALLIILLTITIVYPVLRYSQKNKDISSDVIGVISNLKVGDIDNDYIRSLISDGLIEEPNKSILEQIGYFYVANETIAKRIGEEVLSYLNSKENIGIWYDDVLIASKSSSSYDMAKNIDVDSQIISGVRKGESVKGYSSKAFLNKADLVKYFYFGGYIGDGNISARIDYEGELKDVRLEVTINKDFDVYINGIFSGHYPNSSSLNPAVYNLNDYISNFNNGENIVKLVADEMYIAGGYIKISYDGIEYNRSNRYYLPGVEGIINLYDGFYAPSLLEDMKIYLHANSDYKMFLKIGNKTVFNDVLPNSVILDNEYLSALLDYEQISGKTVPLRLGLENLSYITNYSIEADVISVTDLSGSMTNHCKYYSLIGDYEVFWCCRRQGGCGTKSGCEACSGTWLDKLTNMQEANKVFIDGILNYSGNRVGLVSYASLFLPNYYHNLSNDSVSLKTKVDSWYASGSTCICCGINNAASDLIQNSSSQIKAMVVMSDGQANMKCSQQGTGNAKQNAIKAACDAYEQGIVVHAVGFGSDADTATLQAIANCGNGNYYYGDVEDIIQIYQQVAQDIILATYSEQTISVLGDVHTVLYPDSYIEFKYPGIELPYGAILTYEEDGFDDVSQKVLFIPENSSILEVFAISYSGPRWTYLVKVNQGVVYNLSYYGENFTELGDPYAVNIPVSSLGFGDNTILIKTAVSSKDVRGGSSSDKIIYRVVKPYVSYSKISSYADGCIWDLTFEDSSSKLVSVPLNYTGSNGCVYSPENLIYNENDAVQVAVFNLLKEIDIDEDGRVDINFESQNLQINSAEIIGIPYTWSTKVQVRRWD